MSLKKLNLGCGNDIRPGWVNLDRSALPGVDPVHNIENLPLPFPDETFDWIECKDILEHVEYIPILKDLHRILKTGGTISIQVPHFTSRTNFVDPTHRNFFSFRTFEFFVKQKHHNRDYYFDFHFARVVKNRIRFRKEFLLFDYLIEPVVNCCRPLQNLYELTGWSRLFPANHVEIELMK